MSLASEAFESLKEPVLALEVLLMDKKRSLYMSLMHCYVQISELRREKSDFFKEPVLALEAQGRYRIRSFAISLMNCCVQVLELGKRGIRSLAVARKDDEDGLWRMLGILTFLDPPRPDTKRTIDECRKWVIPYVCLPCVLPLCVLVTFWS